MLRNQMRWISLSERLSDEIIQCRYEGKEIEGMMPAVSQALQMQAGTEKEEACKRVYEQLMECQVRQDFPYREPDDYEEIINLLPAEAEKEFGTQVAEDAVKGAWCGRAIGCLLGIPVETWTRARIEGFLKESGQYPLRQYMDSNVEDSVREKYRINEVDENKPYDRKEVPWINRIDTFPVDDDTNYTVCALRLIEECGREFDSNDVLEQWLLSVPVLHTCTAERIALQNALHLMETPDTAKYLNPYREWIGAQIRGDFFGYINPGRPKKAAAMAYKDAVISHTKNGIYGEMYVAALLSLAADKQKVLALCKNALLQVPPQSRLAEDIRAVIELHEYGAEFQAAIDMIHEKYQEELWFDWCYVNPNAMIVTACILWFENDFSEGISQCVLSGFDTDCNGATVGSFLGMRNGFQAIDRKWLAGLKGELHTSVHRYQTLSFEDAVARTMKWII